MTQPPLQNTRFNQLQTTVGERLLGWVTKRWRDKSVALIALFAGGYTAANVTTLYLSLLKLSLIHISEPTRPY